MFDPDRDDVQARPYYVRLVVTAVITLAIAASLWPSITAYSGDTGARSCIAVIEGWKSAPPDPGPFGSPAAQDRFDQWINGPGLCAPEARHRLIESAIMLTVVLTTSCGAFVVIRRRRRTRRGRPEGRPQVTASVG